MRKFKFLCTISCIVFTYFAVAQQITIDNTISAQQLIENNLVQGCVEVSNITSNINGGINGINSFGYFEQANSNFPFQNGIILTTGDANSAGNVVNTNTLNEGEDNWGTDPDLETALGLSNTLNATSIEFDFISISNSIQFNYILASEEYYGNFPCEYSDGFAFLIKEAGTADPFTNIAVVPGTSTPVNTSTIHPEIVGFCGAENEQYFDGFNIGDTNYNGRTTVLTATASIIPETLYHIKLIIADQTDENYDSAVFIEGNSFNATVDLGEDITTCAESITLDGNIQNPNATFVWYLNDVILNGETNSNLVVTETGNYTVEITIPFNATSCTIEDSILVTLSSEQSTGNVTDFELCDDQSGDETELFDLSVKDNEVLNSVSSGDYNISYHYTQNDADNDINPITSAIQNTSNPQEIFVRIEDINTGCLAYTSFNLVVNPLPELTTPSPLNVCDDEINDGITQIDLTSLDDEILNNQANLTVSYHNSENEALNNQNALISPYINNSPNEIIYVRVENVLTGCINTTFFELNVLENPQLPTIFVQIDACDQDHDGFATFDLQNALDDITQGLTDVTTTIHLTYNDALNGVNSLGNISSFDNTIPDVQNIYIRVENNLTGCASIATIELHTNLLLTGTQIQNFYQCDDDSNNGSEEFNLANIENVIINGLDDVDISFYLTQSDLENNINAIDESIPFNNVSNPQVLYIEIQNQTCTEQSEIQLIVNAPLLIQPIDPVDYCDTDDDGFTAIDMSTFDYAVSNGNSDITTVTYYPTQIDAENNTNALPNFYTNTNNPEIIFARITSNATGCYDTTQFEINIIPAPTVTEPSDVIICDDDQDGMFIVNLTDKIPEIVSDTTDLQISFYTSLNDAESNNSPISDPINFNASTQTIYTRIESNITTCFAIETFAIVINTLPVFTAISDFQICESDGDQNAEFIFNLKDSEILNGQPGKQVLYFETENDAINRINIIPKTIPYQNVSSPQTIYVRVENLTDQDCFGISSFTIVVDPVPQFNAPLNWFVCDDITNDGTEMFDFNEKTEEITSGFSEDLEVTYYLNLNDAQNGTNQLNTEFNNTQNPQQIFVRIENGLSCYEIAEFGLNVIQAPETNASVPLSVCDIDYDGISTFDLTISEFDVLNVRQDEIVVTYFENLDDLESQANVIADPENYQNISNPQTVYLRVTNTVSECFVSVPLELNVNLPPATNPIEDIVICTNETGTYDLSEVYNLIVNDNTNVSIEFFNSLSEAENNSNSIDTAFQYQLDTNVIFTRVENITTGCFIVSSFNLIVNQNPIAHTPNSLEVCDDDYDEIAEFNLSNNNSQILGNQDATNFNVIYFETLEDSQSGENPIPEEYLAFNEQIIYARVENNQTGCFALTQFQTIVHPLAIIDLPDTITICLENLPLTVNADTYNSGDIYEWSTGESTPEIEINEIGEYWINITTPNGCETTKEFTVIVSEQATIELTETVDFSDPNNITITVSGIGDYLYVLDDGEPQESNIFEYVTLGYHTITVIDVNGCNDVTKEVVIIDAPKFFTPNNDGYNDRWHISGVETIPGTVVQIFDRYGKLLKTLTHASLGWDGTYNGNLMAVNDYWFLASVVQNDETFEVRGHFTLKR